MKKFLLVLLFPIHLCGLFDEYKASRAYQENDFQKAEQLYKQVLLENPTDGQTLYNLGDTLYRLDNFEQSRAYFLEATQHLEHNLQLKEQAFFNAGNAYFQQKEYEKAIEQYDKTLELNPENERALYNKKIAQELLKQQQEQKKQQQDNQKDLDKKQQNQQEKSEEQKDQQQNKQEQQQKPDKNKEQKDKQDQDKKEDQQDSEQKDQQQNKQDQQQSSQNQNAEQSHDSGKEKPEGSNKSSQHDDLKKEDNQQEGQQDRNESKGESAQQQQPDHGKEEFDGKPQNAESQNQSKNNGSQSDQRGSNSNDKRDSQGDSQEEGKQSEHSQSSEQKGQITQQENNTTPDAKQQEPLRAESVEEAPETQDQKKEPEYQLMKYIDAQEQDATKRMLKRMIKQEMPKDHGQKNW